MYFLWSWALRSRKLPKCHRRRIGNTSVRVTERLTRNILCKKPEKGKLKSYKRTLHTDTSCGFASSHAMDVLPLVCLQEDRTLVRLFYRLDGASGLPFLLGAVAPVTASVANPLAAKFLGQFKVSGVIIQKKARMIESGFFIRDTFS